MSRLGLHKPLPPRPLPPRPPDMASQNGEIELGRYTTTTTAPNQGKPLPPSPPLRPSLEEAYRDSDDSSSENEDVDELDPLNYDAGTLKRKKIKRPPGKTVKDVLDPAFQRAGTRAPAWQHWLVPSRFGYFLITLFVACVLLLLGAAGLWGRYEHAAGGATEGWYMCKMGGTDPAWADAYAKAAKLVAQMTLPEKVNVTTGIGWQMGMCVGNTGPVERLGFPSLCLQDGPLGLRFARNVTAWPAGITAGATWDKDLIYERGKALGQEARMKGINVLLGPAVGPLGRSPMGGRNWEGFGPDPVLQGLLAAATVQGIQDEHVMATIKHFVGNEQEHFRKEDEWFLPHPVSKAISSNIDDRTLHELYAWPFAAAVKAGVASVMCSYQQVNNSYACQNDRLLNRMLKDEYGFQGFVQSDWGAQRAGVASALAGLDMTMPGDGLGWTDGVSLWGPELVKAALNGSVPIERLNDMVSRIVAAWYFVGQDDKGKFEEDGPNFSSWTQAEIGFLYHGSDDKSKGVVNKFVDVQGEGEEAHKILARKIAADGTVLVKNEENLLPLSREGGEPKTEGAKYRVGVYGQDAIVNEDGPNACEDRGCNKGTLGQGWGSGTTEYPYLVAPLDAIKEAFADDTVNVTSWPMDSVPETRFEDLLWDQDLCIVFANANSGEGYIHSIDSQTGDRNDLHLAKDGDKNIRQIATECGNGFSPTIVVLHTVGPVDVSPWIDLVAVKAVLFANLPGQESGNAIIDILFGDVNPSGRLPYTVGKSLHDYGPSADIMTIPRPWKTPQQDFDEGLYIDYRWFDKHDIEPQFPFGFGLSYTTFELSKFRISTTKDLEERVPIMPPANSTNTTAPAYDTMIPDAEEALFPAGFRKLGKYIYPYVTNTKSVFRPGAHPTTILRNATALPATSYGYQGGHPGLYDEIAKVAVTVTNTGDRDGACVVQLYVEFPRDHYDLETGLQVDFPLRVLRNFLKVSVQAGKKERIHMSLTRKDLSYWSDTRQNWVLPEDGDFVVKVGFSSRDLPEDMVKIL